MSSNVVAVKERPILFRASMVKALLAGRKTQTRRAIKKPERFESIRNCAFCCPYGKPGDRLWVRENGWLVKVPSLQELRDGADTWPKYVYDADEDPADFETFKKWGWRRRPSIHMPRWASRITLEITDVRVERVQEISNRDAVAEGSYLGKCACFPQPRTPIEAMMSQTWCHVHGEEFKHLWQSVVGSFEFP